MSSVLIKRRGYLTAEWDKHRGFLLRDKYHIVKSYTSKKNLVRALNRRTKSEVDKMGERMGIHVPREKGFMYFVDKAGYIARRKFGRGKHPIQRISNEKIAREKGYLYYVDGQGYIARVKMARGKKKRM